MDCDTNNFMMSASISGDVVEKERNDGLVERHAYSLLKCSNESGIKLIQLRNPWGNDKEWNGPWSDDDLERWNAHPELKKSL